MILKDGPVPPSAAAYFALMDLGDAGINGVILAGPRAFRFLASYRSFRRLECSDVPIAITFLLLPDCPSACLGMPPALPSAQVGSVVTALVATSDSVPGWLGI